MKEEYKNIGFGFNSYHPEDKDKTPNHKLILNEINDLEIRLKELRQYIAEQS